MKSLMYKEKYNKAAGLFILGLLMNLNLSSQVVSANLKAVWYNGKTTIQVATASLMSSYFASSGGTVDINFYFSEDDPRNGIHIGVPTVQSNGKINVTFADLPYQANDSLTFIATELFPASPTRHYVFVRGDYFPESGGPINTCPIRFTCGTHGLVFYFDPKEIILDPSSISPISLVIPNANFTTTVNLWAINVGQNAISIKIIPGPDCSLMMSGTAIFTINGITCTFENGQLNCPEWVDVPDNLSVICAPYFINCALDLVNLLNDVKYTLPCKQWVDYDQCKTTTLINRSGNVAIATEKFAPNAALTVKNGIITDKVKVTNSGWADYVFDPAYTLMPLEEVETYILKYHHLPGTQSAEKVEATGSFELGETTIDHQVKIEELFLYLIGIEEDINVLEALLALQRYNSVVQNK